MRLISLLILVITSLQSPSSFAQENGTLSIVLDDLGYSVNDFQALSLPLEITFSILPFTPQGKQLAEKAHQQGRALLLHIPMQAKSNNSKLGKGALMADMQEAEFKSLLRRSLRYLPDAQGINNHMGSLLTEQLKPMRWTMEVLQTQGLYFLDSRTTIQSVAQSTAKLFAIPALRRNVFLDNIKTQQAMNKQFQLAMQLSQRNRSVVIIAHPYPETLRFLQQKLNHSTTQIKLIALNQLIPKAQRLAMAKKRNEFQQANNLISTPTLPQTQ
ncbi:MAG: divergent polysaccharide deacetylase family protein [Psychromonas sp.]|nr:divergent polysaccharide deacetylase family protein [Psychromonas sp.]